MLRIQKNIRQNYDRGAAAREVNGVHTLSSSHTAEALTAHTGAHER